MLTLLSLRRIAVYRLPHGVLHRLHQVVVLLGGDAVGGGRTGDGDRGGRGGGAQVLHSGQQRGTGLADVGLPTCRVNAPSAVEVPIRMVGTWATTVSRATIPVAARAWRRAAICGHRVAADGSICAGVRDHPAASAAGRV
jgi:hypothetical protein